MSIHEGDTPRAVQEREKMARTGTSPVNTDKPPAAPPEATEVVRKKGSKKAS